MTKELVLEFIDELVEEIDNLTISPQHSTYIWDGEDMKGELRNLKSMIELLKVENE